jgi:arylsulfatase A
MVGTLVTTLESDNGSWIRFETTASHPLYGEARLMVGSALPFRDGKGSTWEGGMRVPGVWYWPGTIPPRTLVRTPAMTMDVLPTAFAPAGDLLPGGRTLDGCDIWPMLSSGAFPGTVPDFQLVYTGNSENAIYAVRKGLWKLHNRLYSQNGNNHGFTASQSHPLHFNVEQDPHKGFDRPAQETAVASEMQAINDGFDTSLNSERTFWNVP